MIQIANGYKNNDFIPQLNFFKKLSNIMNFIYIFFNICHLFMAVYPYMVGLSD